MVEVQLGSHSEEQLQRVATEMSQGMKLLTHRQKLIKFADRSELG